MKNKFKLLTIAIMTLFITVGCSSESPSDVVNNYFTEIKKGINADVNQLFKDSLKEESNTDDKDSAEINEAMEIYLSKIDMKVLDESIENDKASVKVELTGLNFANIIVEVLEETLSNMFEVQDNSSDNLDADLLAKIKSASTESREGTINLVKEDNNWKIESDNDLAQLLFGYMK